MLENEEEFPVLLDDRTRPHQLSMDCYLSFYNKINLEKVMPHNEQSSDHPKRKLTTILAADVVGYSRMMGADEDGTYELLGKCRKIIGRNVEHHDGRIFNTAGDSVMAEFGSTVEAVRCAIEIQEEIVAHNTNKPAAEQMWFRIGINVGDVIIEGDDLIGDGVNVASRMESIATPSGICISGSAYELVRNKLSYAFENMGKQEVKNIVEPVTAYSLLLVATPQIKPDMVDKLPPRLEEKRRSILPIVLISLVFVVGAVIAAIYFAGKDFDKNNSTILQSTDPSPTSVSKSVQPDKFIASDPVSGVKSAQNTEKMMTKTSDVVKNPQIDAQVLPPITASYFVGRTVEGVTRKTHERFVIEMMDSGSAFVSIYKINKPTEPRFVDTGRWWINQEGWICYKFGRFADGVNLCRNRVVEEGQEWLVVDDPTKPKWVLNSR